MSTESSNKGTPEEGKPPDQPSQQQQLTIQQALDLALRHHSAGDLPKAEEIYQLILEADPNHPAALQMLGVIAHQVGKNDIAVDLIAKALAIKPDFADAHNNLGNAFRELARRGRGPARPLSGSN